MRLLLAVLAVAVLFAAGFFLVPLLLTHVPAMGVGLGLVLLLTGLLWPTKATCVGLHCANCSDHH